MGLEGLKNHLWGKKLFGAGELFNHLQHLAGPHPSAQQCHLYTHQPSAPAGSLLVGKPQGLGPYSRAYTL